MHADIDETIHIKLDGELAKLLIKVDESYAQFLTYENGTPVIYCELSKALYGTLQAAKLFWENLTDFLCNELGFTRMTPVWQINPSMENNAPSHGMWTI